MIYFKSCPRCHGDMHVNSDIYGEYKECLTCGLIVDTDKKSEMLASSMAGPKKKKKKRRQAA